MPEIAGTPALPARRTEKNITERSFKETPKGFSPPSLILFPTLLLTEALA